jgi:hypothetical protein
VPNTREKERNMSETTSENKALILSELWLGYKTDDNFEDFFSYNDLGLPLAYAVANGIVKATEVSDRFINETFNLLLASLEVEDQGFEELDDIFIVAPR